MIGRALRRHLRHGQQAHVHVEHPLTLLLVPAEKLRDSRAKTHLRIWVDAS